MSDSVAPDVEQKTFFFNISFPVYQVTTENMMSFTLHIMRKVRSRVAATGIVAAAPVRFSTLSGR